MERLWHGGGMFPDTDEHLFGFKFLNPDGCTTRIVRTQYILPGMDQEWSDLLTHQAAPDRETEGATICGCGRYHVMRRLDACYAPPNWTAWYARAPRTSLYGVNSEKFSTSQIQLRAISKDEWGEWGRLGFLVRARLHGGNLSGIDFHGCDLKMVCFHFADLRGCNFRDTNLYQCDLRETRVEEADFRSAKGLSDWSLKHLKQHGALI